MDKRTIIDELEFEVPYGKLAAKTWHEETEDCKRILLLHGWMDNAASFDTLAPLLKYDKGLYIVAIDFPGHGRSAQLPPGSTYTDMNMMLEIRRCLTELEWIQPVRQPTGQRLNCDGIGPSSLSDAKIGDHVNDASDDGKDHEPRKKFTVIAHSMGAGLAVIYSSLFPDDVEELILLDFVKAKTLDKELMVESVAQTMDQFIETVPSQTPFSSPILSKSNFAQPNKIAGKGQVIVSQEAAIVATIEAHKQLGDLTRDDARCLLKRSTIPVSSPPNSVIYSRDLRLQCMLNVRENFELNLVMLSRIKCHIISILAKNGLYSVSPFFKDRMSEMQDFLRSKAKSYKVQWVEGDHYIHLNRSELIAALINEYIKAPAQYQVKPI